MGTLETILLMLLILDAGALGILVILQQGKGADIGAAFGSGSANTVFGSAGSASFLAKLTSWLAIGFFVISFGLAYMAKQRAVALRDEGMPLVSAPEKIVPPDANAPAPASLPAETDVPGQTGVPASRTAAPPPSDTQLTPKKEPVDSDIPNV
jgi:preprotein translocase subunit SecG